MWWLLDDTFLCFIFKILLLYSIIKYLFWVPTIFFSWNLHLNNFQSSECFHFETADSPLVNMSRFAWHHVLHRIPSQERRSSRSYKITHLEHEEGYSSSAILSAFDKLSTSLFKSRSDNLICKTCALIFHLASLQAQFIIPYTFLLLLVGLQHTPFQS